jgi:hypothetical protein
MRPQPQKKLEWLAHQPYPAKPASKSPVSALVRDGILRRILPLARSASTRGSLSPLISAPSIARAETPDSVSREQVVVSGHGGSFRRRAETSAGRALKGAGSAEAALLVAVEGNQLCK